MKTLIIDDVPQVVELIRQTLLRAGVARSPTEIRGSHSVAQARLELLRHRPDLIVLDELLPGESSQDLLHDPALAGIPILLVSATASQSPAPSAAPGQIVLGRLPKWGWDALDRVADEVRRMLSRKP